MRVQRTERRLGRVRAISPRGKTWMNGSTLRVRFLDGKPGEQAIAREQAAWWSAVANVRFDFNDAPDAEIRIRFDPNDGAWSYIGTDCRNIAANDPTMNLGFLDGGTAAHEFGHAIGLAHEHQSPFGGIAWNEDVVIKEMAKSPNFWDAATTRFNILRKYSVDQVNGTKFDPDSIMLYFFPGTWTKSGIGTKANETLSALDKSFVAGAAMYPKTAATAVEATDLKVNATKKTRAALGKAGEEDLYHFSATKDGRYVIETSGPTDVVMKLFGPNSTTAVIDEDDDSGAGLNARIASDLPEGEYYVQVRHYQKKAGGNYTIGVRRL